MGGKSLKNTVTKRIDRGEFEKISKEIMDILKLTFGKVGIPFFYRKKESFGDIDFVVSTKDFKGDIREYIERVFKPNEIFKNSNVYSFDYNEVQIDLILTSDEHYQSFLNYMGGNDLGNYIGRLAHSIGLRYGQEGLWLTHYSDSNTKHKIMISKDYRKIFKVLGLDYDKWLEGFDTLEEIFNYVLTSHLFNPDRFQFVELNRINRERNLKRVSYMLFLEFIKDKSNNPMYDEVKIQELRNGGVIDLIRDKFPETNIDLRFAEINYGLAKKNLIKLKFNGGLIKDKYGLEGKELGDSIQNFKNYIESICYEIDFSDFILGYDNETIWMLFNESLEERIS